MSYESLIGEDYVTIRRPTITQDGSGGAVHTPYKDRADETFVPARVESLSTSQRLQYQSLMITVTHRIFLPGDADVRNGDLLITSDGQTIRVNGYNQNRGIGGIDTFLELTGEEVRPQ